MKKHTIIIPVAILLSLFMGVLTPAQAQETASRLSSPLASELSPKCWALDIVMLIDQSGSMFGENGSDPDGYRFEATREVLDQLIQNKQDQCIDAVHRIGLVTFSDSGTTYMPLKPITLHPEDDPDVWSAQYLELIKEAENSNPGDQTNFEGGFAQVQDVFSQATSIDEPDGYGPRRQVVIFITDGFPTVDLNGQQPTTSALMCSVKDYLSNAFWKDKAIWILPLRAGRDYLYDSGCADKTIQQNLDEIASGGLVDLPYNEQAIPAFVSSVVDSEFGQTSEKVSCDDIFYVDPYMQKMTLRFYRQLENTNARVTLTKLDDSTGDPVFVLENGTVMEGRDDVGNMKFDPTQDYRLKGSKEEYTIKNPLPGAWRYQLKGVNTADCMRQIEGRKIQFVSEVELLEADAVFAQVEEAPFYDQNIVPPLTFTVKLRNSDDLKYVESDPDFPLRIQIEWTLPSGHTTLPNGSPIIPYDLSYTSDRRWQNEKQPVLTPEEGLYKLEIIGVAPSGDGKGQEKELFREIRSFNVKKLESLRFTLEEPAASEYYACNKVRDGQSVPNPILVRVRMQSNLPSLTSNLDQSFQASLLQENGQELLDSAGNPVTIYLQAVGDGTFEGVLLAGEQQMLGCGSIMLRARFIGTYDETTFAMPQREVYLPMNRVQASGVWLRESDNRSVWLQSTDQWIEYENVLQPGPYESDDSRVVRRYENTLDACSAANVMPMSFRFKLVDNVAEDAQSLRIDAVLGEGKSALYKAELEGPSFVSSFDLLAQDTENGLMLVGESAEIPINEGHYVLTITPIPSAFGKGFVAGQDSIVYEFDRRDTFFTTATACKTAKGLLAVLSLFIFSACVFAVTGGPGGTIAFLDDRNDGLFTRGLSKMRLMSLWRYGSANLREKGIKYARFSQGASTKNSKSVHVKLVDTNGEVIHDSDVPAEMNLPVADGIFVLYQHPQHKQDDNFI